MASNSINVSAAAIPTNGTITVQEEHKYSNLLQNSLQAMQKIPGLTQQAYIRGKELQIIQDRMFCLCARTVLYCANQSVVSLDLLVFHQVIIWPAWVLAILYLCMFWNDYENNGKQHT